MSTNSVPAQLVPRKKSLSHLSPEQISLIEQCLLRERARVLRSSEELQALVAMSEDKLRGDLADVSSDWSSREHASLFASRTGERFRIIEAALAQLRNAPEAFGRCDVCGDPIPFERLELLPTTRTCQLHAH